MSILPRLIERLNAISIKILSAAFVFVEIDKNILKSMWRAKESE